MAKKSNYLYGKNSVLERIRKDPSSIRKIFLQEGFNEKKIISAIEAENIPVTRLSEKDLLRVKRAERLQGIVAEAARFRYEDFKSILHMEETPTLLFLDNLNDPHNLGSIMRIAACFGGFAVVIPERNSCEVNETVLHVASGGENYLPVARVTNLSRAITEAKKAGYWAAGAVVEGGSDLTGYDLPSPLCLVLGSEGSGLRHGLMKHLDILLTLPMGGARLSFNVAMSFAVFGYEISRQKNELYR